MTRNCLGAHFIQEGGVVYIIYFVAPLYRILKVRCFLVVVIENSP